MRPGYLNSYTPWATASFDSISGISNASMTEMQCCECLLLRHKSI